MTQAERIRQFVLDRYVKPSRSRGDDQVSVRAGDVHREMRLTSAMPAVCSAIGSTKFADLAGVTLSARAGPKNGSTVTFTFALSELSQHGQLRSTPRPEPLKEVQAPKAHLHRSPRLAPAETLNLSGALVLLSCVKSKRSNASPARDLYVSDLFKKSRAVVEAQDAEWRILSALHGLVDPDQVIEPYEYTLKGKGVGARRAWAEEVLQQLLPLATRFGRVVFFAGETYREFLQEPLRQSGVIVEVPMQGLSLGQQLAWLGDRS